MPRQRRSTIAALLRTYRQEFPTLCCGSCDHDGGGNGPGTLPERRLALTEAMRFGEPVVVASQTGFLWAVPLLDNAVCVGGLLAGIAESDLFPAGLQEPSLDVRAACRRLLDLAIAGNWTNDALLAGQRATHRREAERAAALHRTKIHGGQGLREISGREEAELVAAVRAGDRRRAIGILNRVLVGIYHHAGSDLALCKSLLLELLVVMGRCAAESGCDTAAVLRGQLERFGELQDVGDEEGLTRWLRRAVEHLFDAWEAERSQPSDLDLRRVMAEMEERCTEEDLDRSAIARSCSLSPTALSRLLTSRLGRGFTEQLNILRIARAKALLEGSELSLLHIALDCGYKDPSYFTKVFRRHVHMTPKEYRRFNRR